MNPPGFLAKRRHRQLAALPGVHAVRRPVTPGTEETFDLHYVRTGRTGGTPLVIIPGGPGMASILAYQGIRKRAAAAGHEVIMVEHRGVGMSRRDDSGADLPPEALTIAQVVDDVAAVLDDADIDTAAVYGASYGTYLAAGFGVRHPNRVRAMVLDSPLLSRDDFDVVRSEARALLWHADTDLAAKVRALTEVGALIPEDLTVTAVVYGIGGPDLLERHLDLLLDGRRALWAGMRWAILGVARRKVPYRNEFDLIGAMGFRELNFAGTPDGQPLDTTLTWRGVPASQTPFEGEPFDLVAEMPGFRWPTVVVSGGRDLITPAAVADRIAGLVPAPIRIQLPTVGHSILDSRQNVALRIIADVAEGRPDALAGQDAALESLPEGTSARMAGTALAGAARLAAALPRTGRSGTSTS